MVVAAREVEALGEQSQTGEVLVGQDHLASRSLPQRPIGRIALDPGTGRRVAGEAVGERLRKARRADHILDLDVEIVRCQREPRDEARLHDHAGRVGVGTFRRQIAVAAEQTVVLVGRVGSDVAILGRGNPGKLTLSQGCGGGVDAGRRDGARIV